MARTLVIYYSRKGENYVSGKIVSLEKGNTEIAAEYIKDAVGADLFEIVTKKDYPENYAECTKEAKTELRENARPQLKAYLPSIQEYDNIIVAGPCWWDTYPMAVFTQLEKLDFTGKKVFPLMTHEGSGLGKSEADLKKYCKNAAFGKGLALHGTDIIHAKSSIADWCGANLE